MKKTGTIIKTAVLTFAVGGALIFGSAMVMAQTSAEIDVENPAQATGAPADALGGEQAGGDPADVEPGGEGYKTLIKRLPNGSTVLVKYYLGEDGAKAAVTYGDGSVHTYEGKAAEASIERFGGPKRDLPDRYVEGRPGDGDISEESAVSAALEAIKSKYALTDETLDRFSVTPIFYATYEDIEGAVWYVRLYPKDVNEFTEIGAYWTVLDPATGEALQVLSSATDGKG
jgi:hypothetical protein